MQRTITVGASAILYVALLWILILEIQMRYPTGVPAMKWTLIAATIGFPLMMVRHGLQRLRRQEPAATVLVETATVIAGGTVFLALNVCQ
jgi:hypothetical protein